MPVGCVRWSTSRLRTLASPPFGSGTALSASSKQQMPRVQEDLEGSLSVMGAGGAVEVGGFAMNEIRHWNFLVPESWGY